MLNAMLPFNKITQLDDAHLIAPMKRGCRRGDSRKTPIASSWLDQEKIMRHVDAIEIGLMKRGSRRTEIRQRQMSGFDRPDIIIAFPPFVRALPAAANN